MWPGSVHLVRKGTVISGQPDGFVDDHMSQIFIQNCAKLVVVIDKMTRVLNDGDYFIMIRK